MREKNALCLIIDWIDSTERGCCFASAPKYHGNVMWIIHKTSGKRGVHYSVLGAATSLGHNEIPKSPQSFPTTISSLSHSGAVHKCEVWSVCVCVCTSEWFVWCMYLRFSESYSKKSFLVIFRTINGKITGVAFFQISYLFLNSFCLLAPVSVCDILTGTSSLRSCSQKLIIHCSEHCVW